MGEFKLKRLNKSREIEIIHCEHETANPMQKMFLDCYDDRIQDILFYCIEDTNNYGFHTIDDIIKDEFDSNYSNGKPMCGYRLYEKTGTKQSLEELFERYSYIWDEYLFIEHVGFLYDQLQWFYKLKESISSVDEMLFWTIRLCGWGGYDFFHMYSFYKKLSAGKMSRFFDCPNEVLEWFIPDK